MLSHILRNLWNRHTLVWNSIIIIFKSYSDSIKDRDSFDFEETWSVTSELHAICMVVSNFKWKLLVSNKYMEYMELYMKYFSHLQK